MITIRDYQTGDFIDIMQSYDDPWNGAHKEVFDALHNSGVNDIMMCRVAVYDEKVIGYIYGFALPNKMLIPDFLYVNPQCRGRNIGRKLLADFEKKSGCSKSMIFHNKSLHTYYEQQGYQYGDDLEVALKELPVTKDGAM